MVPLITAVSNNQNNGWFAQVNEYLLTNTLILLMVIKSTISHLLSRIRANGQLNSVYQNLLFEEANCNDKYLLSIYC